MTIQADTLTIRATEHGALITKYGTRQASIPVGTEDFTHVAIFVRDGNMQVFADGIQKPVTDQSVRLPLLQ